MAAREEFDPAMPTLLGGDVAGPALPFDPRASGPTTFDPPAPASQGFDPRVTVARYLTAEEAMSAGTVALTAAAVSPSLPFRRPGSDPPAAPSAARSAAPSAARSTPQASPPSPPPPPPLPVMLTERPIWERPASDSFGTPPARVLPFDAASRGTLDAATGRGLLAASDAAAAVQVTPPFAHPPVDAASRVRWIDDDEGNGATLLPVEVLFAPSAPSPALRRASAAHVGCCGVARLQASTDATPKDDRAAAQHAMSHATPRSPVELQRELERALASGAALPSFALTGTLTMSLDPAELFKVTHALARTFLAEATHGELLALASRVGAELGALPLETVSQITSRLEDAVRAQARNLSIETMREQSVLSRRRYLETPVFGEMRIAARLRLSTGGDLPCFLPCTAGASLPLSRIFHAHVVAVVRTAPWPGDGAIALDALALGREIGSRSTRDA